MAAVECTKRSKDMNGRLIAGSQETITPLCTPTLHDQIHPCSLARDDWHLTVCLTCPGPAARAATFRVRHCAWRIAYCTFCERYKALIVTPCAAQDEPIKDASKTGIILCGQPEMGEAVKKLVISQGIAEDRILTNF